MRRRPTPRGDLLAEEDGRTFVAMTVGEPWSFVPPFSATPFACLIWDHEGRITDAEQAAVADTLLEAGCRYVLCGGEDCEGWHEMVDMRAVIRDIDAPAEDGHARLVMTTGHDGESPDEVAFFFVMCTSFDGEEFERNLVLHVGTGPQREQVNEAVRMYALDS